MTGAAPWGPAPPRAPDDPPPAAPEGETRWPCESCGAVLRFVPGAAELRCDHCGHVQPIPPAPARERARALAEIDLARGLADDLAPGETAAPQVTRCPSCGALVEFAGATHATQCPFCAAPVAVGTGSERRIKPQALVPFALTEDAARAAMAAWLGRLWFAPRGLLAYARRGRAMSGIYTPWWTFDAASRSRYAGERGTHYYETRTVTVTVNGRREHRQEQVRRTRWQAVGGWVSRRFDDVAVVASTGLPRARAEALGPWDLSGLVPYSPDWLAGMAAEAYTLPLAEGHARARAAMEQAIAADVRAAIGGDEQRITRIDTAWSDETFRHVLLPVWLAAYRHGGRSYRVMVNGQTGKVRGERPWSAWKIALAVLLVAVAAAAALWLAGGEGPPGLR